MLLMRNELKLSIILSLYILFFYSCSNKEPDFRSAEDDSMGNAILVDIFSIANSEAGNDGSENIPYPEGMFVERDTVTHTINISFIDCNYLGRVRNGKMNILYEKIPAIGERAANTTVTFEDYIVDDIEITGTLKAVFGGTYENPEFNISSYEMQAIFPDEQILLWASYELFYILEGYDTYTVDDDVIEISGTASGINREVEEFSASYDSLIINKTCTSWFPVSGITVINSNDNTETTIDYGDGECDNIIEVSSGGDSETIYLYD